MDDTVPQWWSSVPIVTKYLFASFGGITLLSAGLGIPDPSLLVYNYHLVFHKFQIWRLITCIPFLGGLGWGFLLNMYYLYSYSKNLEMSTFLKSVADYVFMLLIGSVLLLVFAFFADRRVVGKGLIMMILYVWSRKNANVEVSFMFGIRFKAPYLPWVLIFLDIVLGGDLVLDLVGIAIGHLYFYLDEIYPLTRGGRRLLKTPPFLKRYLGQPEVVSGTRAGAPAAAAGGGHTWGRGQSLGR
eukprot:TRINITY_DN1694_c0_g2_i1.p1 TRINITY_DN1694_c0_g2~~TRINITY_DN1694_c0_g2_i1.p1  ORF type:complete len:242 (-),score=26.51 TRINITY_DN1694_c0_g2_i1:102-827(-)